jgi:hypothetical protein
MHATTVPVTVRPEADELINELGLRGAINQMIEHTRQVVADLHSIEVTRELLLAERPEERRVVIEAVRTGPTPPEDPTDKEWQEWLLQSFPRDVSGRVIFLLFDRG